MKICILSIVNIKHMSAASLYLDYFAEQGIKYDIIYIDKYSKLEKINAENIYRYELKINREWSKLKKVSKYIGFRKFAKQILNKNKYDLVITWGTETALLFSDYLIRKLKNRYIINIRDYANLNNKLKYSMLQKVVLNSCFTTISSKGFKSFLPKHDYVLVHSLNRSVLDKANLRTMLREKKDPIRICFIGYVRFINKDKLLIDSLGNDKRFVIQYFGVGSEVLEQYAMQKSINNVEFVHSFDVEQTAELLNRADIINNLYGNDDIALNTAVSIKYFYAAYLRLPILVYKDTYMENISKDIGFVFNNNYKDLGDRIFNWYHNIDFKMFNIECEKIIRNVENDNMEFYDLLNGYFVKSEK
jgi:hypothetical protein